MTTYILRRLLLVIPTLFGITLVTFLLIRLAPGNAAMLKGGAGPNGGHAVTAEAREATIKLYGLDENPFVAYGKWVGNLARLNFGESFVDHRPVIDKIRERIGLSVSLAGTALFLSYLIAVPLGIVAALRRGQPLDRAISFTVFFLYSIPSLRRGAGADPVRGGRRLSQPAADVRRQLDQRVGDERSRVAAGTASGT